MHIYGYKDELQIDIDVHASMFSKVMPCILSKISYKDIYMTINQEIYSSAADLKGVSKNISGLITEYILPKSPF